MVRTVRSVFVGASVASPDPHEVSFCSDSPSNRVGERVRVVEGDNQRIASCGQFSNREPI